MNSGSVNEADELNSLPVIIFVATYLWHGMTSGIVDTPITCCYVECNQVKVFPCCHLSLLSVF